MDWREKLQRTGSPGSPVIQTQRPQARQKAPLGSLGNACEERRSRQNLSTSPAKERSRPALALVHWYGQRKKKSTGSSKVPGINELEDALGAEKVDAGCPRPRHTLQRMGAQHRALLWNPAAKSFKKRHSKRRLLCFFLEVQHFLRQVHANMAAQLASPTAEVSSAKLFILVRIGKEDSCPCPSLAAISEPPRLPGLCRAVRGVRGLLLASA